MGLSGVVLAVDFGTFNTVAVLARDGVTAEPLLFDGAPTMPSAVLATGGRFLVGRDALRAVATDPALCEPNPKRRIDYASVLLGDTEYPTVDVIAAVLTRVAEVTRQVIGAEPDEVVLTHPVAWGNVRRDVLVNAAKGSGLSVRPRLIAEPVAAARRFLHGDGHALAEGERALVFDLGAGTCDLTVLVRHGGRIEVAATDGMNDVGGLDVDHLIVEHLRERYPDAPGWARLSAPSTPGDRRQRRLLWEDVRAAKEQLSRETQTSIHIPVLDVETHLTRAELDGLILPMLRPAARLAHDLTQGVGDAPVNRIYLTGGASRMPLVATQLLRELGITPTLTEQPELVIATGAAWSVAPMPPPAPLRTPPVSIPAAPPPGPPLQPPPAPKLRRRALRLGGLTAAGAAIVGTAGFLLWPSGPTTITAHGDVTALALSPDGTRLAALSKGVLQVFDTGSGETVWETDGDAAYTVAFSPDGRRLVSGREGAIPIWDTRTWDHTKTIHIKPELQGDNLAFSPKGTTFTDGHLVYGLDGSISSYLLAERGVTSVDYSPDGEQIMFSDENGIAVAKSDDLRKPESLAINPAASVGFGPQGKTFVIARAEGDDIGGHVYDTKTRKKLRTLTTTSTSALAFDRTNNRIATTGTGGVRLWDAGTGELTDTLTEATGQYAAINPEGTVLAIGGFQSGANPKSLQLWTL